MDFNRAGFRMLSIGLKGNDAVAEGSESLFSSTQLKVLLSDHYGAGGSAAAHASSGWRRKQKLNTDTNNTVTGQVILMERILNRWQAEK